MKKNILVTGGAGGIGQEIVKIFVKNNYFVHFIDIDDTNGILLEQEIGQEKCKYIHLDVTDVDGIKEYVNKLPEDFQINHIITLAGRALESEWKPLEEQDLSEIKDSVSLNLLGHINIILSFLKFLRQGKDDKSVLMIASVNAQSGFGLPAYSAAKSGMYGFVHATAEEFGNMGIRINTISPGTVVTPNTKKEPKNFSTLLEGTLLNKFATVYDIAEAAYAFCNVFLSVTGQDFVVDAGQMIKH